MVFSRAAYINKAHYFFVTYDEASKTYKKPYWKIRSFRLNETNQLNPVFLLLRHLVSYKPEDSMYNSFRINNDGL